MPDQIKLLCAGATIALVVAHDIKTQIKAKTAADLYLKAYNAFQEMDRVNEAKIEYLCHMLNEHGVPADEFDIIALNFYVQ